MNIGRALGLTAWAAIAAAWALPTPGMVQKSSGFTSVPNNGHSLDAERVQEHAAAHPIGAWPHDAGLVDHLGEPLAPEDYSALANPNLRGLLPPVEFAHPYQGRVLLLRGQSQAALRRICGKQPEGVLLGCARKPDASGVPFVVLADDATVRANGWTMNLNELHEAGHLNGAWTHDGWRDLAQMGSARPEGIGAPAAAASPRPVETPAKPMPEGRPKAIVVAQADAVGTAEPHVPPENQYDGPPPRRHPRPRYDPEGRPWHHEPPVYGPPPGWIFIPSEQRAMPCLPTLMTFGVLRFCI
jgi:hypothetical protein